MPHKEYANGEPFKMQRIAENEWMYSIECCDCGLQHLFFYWKKGKMLFGKPFRDDFATDINRKDRK